MVGKKIIKWVGVILVIAVTTCAMRMWWWEVFRVPTKSMAPTLSVNDFILVNKIAFGFPLSQKRAPNRGDVVVFPHPQKHALYVKRVIGLPHDEVMILGGKVWINGDEFEQVRPNPENEFTQQDANVEQRQLSNGATYRTLSDKDPMAGWNISGYWTVPADQVFVLGDWRDHSSDSREWGSIPIETVVGKVVCSWGESSKGCQF